MESVEKLEKEIEGNINYDTICPFMSREKNVVYCRKDCGMYSGTLRKCSFKAIMEYFHYKKR